MRFIGPPFTFGITPLSSHITIAGPNAAVAVEDIPSAAYPTPAKRPANSRLDCASLEAAFGIGRPDWRAHLKDVLGELGALA